MTHKEYIYFLSKNFINSSGKILNHDAIKKFRAHGEDPVLSLDTVNVCVELLSSANQQTAERLETIGLVVEEGIDNEILGTIHRSKLPLLKMDIDVKLVEVSGE